MDGSYIFQVEDNSPVPFIYSLRKRQMAVTEVQEDCPREEGVVRATEDEPMPLVKYMAGVIGIEI